MEDTIMIQPESRDSDRKPISRGDLGKDLLDHPSTRVSKILLRTAQIHPPFIALCFDVWDHQT
jgi:hypothetical protein